MVCVSNVDLCCCLLIFQVTARVVRLETLRQALGMLRELSSLILIGLNIVVLAGSSLHPSQTSSLSSGRIIGGTDAAPGRFIFHEFSVLQLFPGEFPHLVMITRGVCGSFMCTGSLVSNKAVVTAGHCCDG